MTDITANVVVSMPSQLFTMARSFKAVANGKIYIGKIDTDPVNPENQIQVYVDNEDGSHVPVSQPIIINAAGYPVYNGQIAKFVTVQGHSMAVYDSYNVQQFYFPNVLKYDPDQLRQQLASASVPGASLVVTSEDGSLQDVVDNLHSGDFQLTLPYRSYTVTERLDAKLTTSAMGAVGDGSTDDTAAVQLAIDTLSTLTRKATLYIDGRCKVSSLTIPATLSLHMVGNNVGGASYSRSALICQNATGPTITCNGSACTFEDIQFVGASNYTAGGGDTTQTAILFAPGVANSYNCDGLVKGCGFIFFNKIIDLRGRNLKLVDNIFSNSAFGVWIGATGIPDFRALDIQGCRFHYMSAEAGNETTPTAACAVYVAPNTNFFNINITGNLSDGGKWFFVGAAAWGVIDNNHFNAQQTGVLYHYNTGMTLGTLFHRTSFSNNVVTHTFVTSPNGQTDTVYLVAGWGVDVLNNTINNAHRRAINNGVPNTRIAGNTLIEAGFITGGFPVIESTGANASIMNNILVRYGTVASVPSVGIKASNFTSVDGNRFTLGFGASGVPEWDTSSRGDTLIYGVMDIAALPSEEWGTAAPTSGRYLRGSKVWNTNVTAGGTLGWVCVASGTPGTWKGYGGVAP
ncbi:phage tailspike protein [Escherichia coli]|uniref:phage head-binding domain-containing protein n=1 Tax=Escherichia coli TaxID=562 RepID=UPI003F8C3927